MGNEASFNLHPYCKFRGLILDLLMTKQFLPFLGEAPASIPESVVDTEVGEVPKIKVESQRGRFHRFLVFFFFFRINYGLRVPLILTIYITHLYLGLEPFETSLLILQSYGRTPHLGSVDTNIDKAAAMVNH